MKSSDGPFVIADWSLVISVGIKEEGSRTKFYSLLPFF